MTTDSRRPWALWIFSLIITLVALYNFLLAWDQFANARHYRDLGVSYPPALRAGLAGVWGLAFLLFARGMARRRRWARRGLLLLISNYGAFGVLWLRIYARSDAARDRLPFFAGLTLAAVALTAALLRWRRIREPWLTAPGEHNHG